MIYDLETTGLYPDDDEFIQIAAVRYQEGCIIAEDSFFSFARPRRPISSFIESYTGIGNRHVVGAPRPEEVLCSFAQWAGDATLIAHNGLRFDSKFLAATCRRHGLGKRRSYLAFSVKLLRSEPRQELKTCQASFLNSAHGSHRDSWEALFQDFAGRVLAKGPSWRSPKAPE